MNRTSLALLIGLALTAVACKEEPKKDPAPAVSAATTASSAPVAVKEKEEPKGTTFTNKAPTVGMKWETKRTTKMTMSLDVDVKGDGKKKEKSEMENSTSEVFTEEVLAVDGDKMTKVKVTFTAVDEVSKESGKERKRPSPIVGKTYVAEFKDGKIVVLTDKEKPAPPVEATRVAARLAHLGKSDPVAPTISGKPLIAGQKVDAMATALQDFLKQDDGEEKAKGKATPEPKFEAVTATFKDVAGDNGVFVLSMKMSMDEGPMAMSFDLKGTATIAVATARPVKLELSGPMTVTARPDPKNPTKVEGTGKMEMTQARTML